MVLAVLQPGTCCSSTGVDSHLHGSKGEGLERDLSRLAGGFGLRGALMSSACAVPRPRPACRSFVADPVSAVPFGNEAMLHGALECQDAMFAGHLPAHMSPDPCPHGTLRGNMAGAEASGVPWAGSAQQRPLSGFQAAHLYHRGSCGGERPRRFGDLTVIWGGALPPR